MSTLFKYKIKDISLFLEDIGSFTLYQLEQLKSNWVNMINGESKKEWTDKTYMMLCKSVILFAVSGMLWFWHIPIIPLILLIVSSVFVAVPLTELFILNHNHNTK